MHSNRLERLPRHQENAVCASGKSVYALATGAVAGASLSGVTDSESTTPRECSMKGNTDPRIQKKMRLYRNCASVLTVMIEIILFASGAEFWWQAIGLMPLTFAFMFGLMHHGKV